MCVIGQSVCILQFISVVSHTSTELVLVLQMKVQVLVLFRHTEIMLGSQSATFLVLVLAGVDLTWYE